MRDSGAVDVRVVVPSTASPTAPTTTAPGPADRPSAGSPLPTTGAEVLVLLVVAVAVLVAGVLLLLHGRRAADPRDLELS